MAAQNSLNLNKLLSSGNSAVVMTNYLNTLSIDELLKELVDAGVQSVNPVLLKNIIIHAVTPELCEIKVARSSAKTQKPIDSENFRMQSIKIHRAFLEVHKGGDKKRLVEVASTLLTNIERLEKWPRIEGQEYATDWLRNTKIRIIRAIKEGTDQAVVTRISPVGVAK